MPRIRDRERRLARRVHGIPDGASAARSHDAAAEVPVRPTRTTTTTAGAIPSGGRGAAGSSSSSNNNNNKQQHVILRRVASATGVGMMLRAMVLTPTRQLDNNLATGSCGGSPLPLPTSDDNYPFTAPAQSCASPPVTTPSPLAVLSRRRHRQTPVGGHATAFTRLRRIGRILRKRKSELPAEKSME